MKVRIFAALALSFSTTSASATSLMCEFWDPKGSLIYDLSFLGYGEIGGILFNRPGDDGPTSLPGESYEVLEFSERRERIHLVYRNPGDASLLPSFTLRSDGKSARMVVAGREIVGKFNCGY